MLIGTYINFTSGWATTTLGYAGTIVSDLSDYIALMVGVLLTLVVVATLIRAIK